MIVSAKADELGGHVHAAAIRGLHHRISRIYLATVNAVVGAERSGPLQLLGSDVDGDDWSRSDQPGQLHGVQTETAHTHDGDRFARAELGPSAQRMERGGDRAPRDPSTSLLM